MGFTIIQGGMGVGVSGWPLARAVSRRGQLGVVSGTGLSVVLARRLANGDADGDLRRALSLFPVPAMAERILSRYFIAGGKAAGDRFKRVPPPRLDQDEALTELTIVANFVEVCLAREGHDGVVGINYLEKLQIPTLPSLLGAMLAGVDYVLMGAGIPRSIPGVLDAFADGLPAELRIDVTGAGPDDLYTSRLDPQQVIGYRPTLPRPKFLAVVSSVVLAMTLARKSNGRVDGFVIEGSSAGGHNAPPRGTLSLSDRGEPLYGERDMVDLAKIRELGLPFYLAGGYGRAGGLRDAVALGAAGVQVGTAFAFCEESSVTPRLKRRAVQAGRDGTAAVFTDPYASPTRFPFKVCQMPGTLSDDAAFAARRRVCDIGHLHQPCRNTDGTVDYRCAAEPVDQYVAKGGLAAETVGRKCLCNALFGTIGLGQHLSSGRTELPVVTAGDDFAQLFRLLKPGHDTYTAADVIDHVLS